MPKKKRKPRAGQFGAVAAAGPPKRSKAAERKKAGATQLAILSQDKGAVGNSIAETAGSFGQAARATQRHEGDMTREKRSLWVECRAHRVSVHMVHYSNSSLGGTLKSPGKNRLFALNTMK